MTAPHLRQANSVDETGVSDGSSTKPVSEAGKESGCGSSDADINPFVFDDELPFDAGEAPPEPAHPLVDCPTVWFVGEISIRGFFNQGPGPYRAFGKQQSPYGCKQPFR